MRVTAALSLILFCLVAGGAARGGSASSPDTPLFRTADGTMLPFRVWNAEGGHPRAVVVALHGFNDYSLSFSLAAPWFTGNGITLYAYDQRGFGTAPNRGIWGGVDRYVDDLRRFTTLVRERHPRTPLYVMGDSMGGAVAIVAATGPDPPSADGLILIAPAVWGRSTMPWYQRLLLAVASRIVPWVTVTGKGLGIRPSDNEEMLRQLSRDPLVIRETRIDTIAGLVDLMDLALERTGRLPIPTLWLYGRNDQVIPPEATLTALKTAPPVVRRAFYDRGFHMLLRDIHRDEPLTDIVTWIGGRDRPLVHGRGEWGPTVTARGGE